ncbi:MAG: 2-oxoacid:ferredoxin oxidoreductase subunit beta [Gemmatimonadota bacterium]
MTTARSTSSPTPLAAKDFASDQEVRWCPGCGDYAILKAIQKTLAEVGARRENTVFISGIGCAARFPYYMDTYGFHTIHGRAPALATGAKLANPDLDVWVITGDGDGLSIGGNHMLHVLRRNVDLQIVLFNNQVYGLTKGQVSPTSRVGTRSPSTPRGSISRPVNPAAMALGAGARFVARAIDIDQAHLTDVLKSAREHRGTSFVEIFQNCVVFNDGAFSAFADRKAAESRVVARHGEPLRYGVEGAKGLRLRPGSLELEIVEVGDAGVPEAELLVHDETSRPLASMLAELEPPDFPMVLGVLYRDPAPVYEEEVYSQLEPDRERRTLRELLHAGRTWRVG